MGPGLGAESTPYLCWNEGHREGGNRRVPNSFSLLMAERMRKDLCTDSPLLSPVTRVVVVINSDGDEGGVCDDNGCVHVHV